MTTVKTIVWRREGTALVVSPQSCASTLAEDDFQADFGDVMAQIKQPQVTAVVVDFSDIEYFGSMMLEALRRLAAEVGAAGGPMVLCCVSEVGLEILQVTHFDTLWPIYPTCEAALAAVASS